MADGRLRNSALFIVCLALIGLALHYLSLRHYRRWDVTEGQLFSLSPKTVAIIQDLPHTIEIYSYFKPEHELAKMLNNLLEAYAVASSDIHVTHIDPYRDFEALRRMGEQGRDLKINTLMIRNEFRSRLLTENELGHYHRQFEHLGVKPTLLSFTGEAAITGTILDLSDNTEPVVALLNNHGERDPNDTGEHGISEFVGNLKLQGFRFTLMPLHQLSTIPDSVHILVSCQPKTAFSDHELLLLQDWLNRGGSLFLAVDPLVRQNASTMLPYDLEPLLTPRGLTLHDTIVVDPENQIPFSRADHLVIGNYSEFDPVRNLKGLPTFFFQARSIGIAEVPGHAVGPLCFTGHAGWGETDFTNSDYQFDPETDVPGPVIIGAASQHLEGQGKIILFGDSDFMTNAQIKSGANLELVQNIFYWMTEKTSLLRLEPKDPKSVSVHLSRAELVRVLIFGVIAFPCLIILAGIGIGWLRR